MKRACLAVPFLLAACFGDETVTGYAERDISWQLVEIDGTPFAAQTTVTLQPNGSFAGQAPCNAFSGKVIVPYPWFSVGTLAVTRRSCPALADEQRFFEALQQMTLAEVAGPTLILTNEAGREMVFAAQE